MEYIYLTVQKTARTEQIIEKSRFITTVTPVTEREEAETFFAGIRKEFRDATHNVPAMVLGEKQQIQWCSDDGEPQGTSGAPIVQMMVAKGLTNVAIMVTRYFGGVKLGTGGLVRAYTLSAELGIETAGLAGASLWSVVPVTIDYSSYNRLISMPGAVNAVMEDVSFTDVVSFNAVMDPEDAGAYCKILRDISSGAAIIGDMETVKRIMPL